MPRTITLTGAHPRDSGHRSTPPRPRERDDDQHREQRRLVCRYDYRHPDGRLFFQKERFEILNPLPGARTKSFGYFCNVWDIEARYRKPDGADGIIYNLPEVLRAIQRGKTVHWTEGEKDSDALIARGHAATTVHQGANKVTVQQAAWLFEAPRIVIWVDKDPEYPDVGAHDAAMRHDLLRRLGYPGVIEFRRARGPWGGLKDIADHLAAGYTVEQGVLCNVTKLFSLASTYTEAANRSAGYAQ